MKERVLKPLAMRSTAITLNKSMQARLAPGHSPYLQPLYVWEMKTIQASGSLRSSANDLLRLLGAYLGNPRSRLADSMALQLRTRSPVPAAKPVVRVAPETLESYAGRYRAKDGIVRVIRKRDHLLVSYEAGDPGLEFVASGEREFFYNAGNDDVAFELDDDGNVTGMRIYPDGKGASPSELAPRIGEGA